MCLYLILMAIKGDLMLPDPSWVSYAPQAAMLHQKHFMCPATLDDDGYHINPDDLAKAIDDARANGGNPTKIILNYPNNPTGLNMPRNEMEAIARVCQEKGVFIVSDEIYGFTGYDGAYHSFAEFTPDNVMVTTGLSKHLALGGWRVGIAMIPKAIPGLTRAYVALQSETSSCLASPISQAALYSFLGDPEIETHIRNCTKIHQHLTTWCCHEMRKAGAICHMPHGGFYLYPDFTPHAKILQEKVGIDSAQDLADFMSEEYFVITLPAQCFMSNPNRLAFRFACNDYKGKDALEALVDGEELDDEFIETYTPNLVQAVRSFQDLARRAGFYDTAYEEKREKEIAEAEAAREEQQQQQQ